MIAIHRLVMNLGTNAAHAMPEGGTINLSVDTATVDALSAARIPDLCEGTYAVLTVADTGMGMSLETQQRIFEPFFSTGAFGKGAGLGLSVVHGIVREHAGAIDVVSAKGHGTRFHIYLPIVSPALAAPGDEPRPVTERGRGQRILLVDDEAALVFLSRRLLTRLGYEVTAHEDPQEALEAFRRDPAAFDALITDLTMPGMSGLDLAARVLAIRGDLPIVLMSGYVSDVEAREAKAMGLGEVHLKSDTVEEIAGSLHRRLSDGR
jgi:CheY-like chemotaxis protein